MSGTPGNADFVETTGTQGKSPGYYAHIINPNSPAPGNYFVWVVDSNNNPLSDPSAGKVPMNDIKNADDPASCWRAVVDFVRK